MLSETDYAADSYLLEDLGRYVFVRDQLRADSPNIPTAAKLGSNKLAQSCNSCFDIFIFFFPQSH